MGRSHVAMHPLIGYTVRVTLKLLGIIVLCTSCAVDHPFASGADGGRADGSFLDAPARDAVPDIPRDSATAPDSTIDAAMPDGGPDAFMPDGGRDIGIPGDAGTDAFDGGCAVSFCDDNELMQCKDGVFNPRDCRGATCMEGTDGWGCYDFFPSNVERSAYPWPLPLGATLTGQTWDTTMCTGMPGTPRVVGDACVVSFGDIVFSGTHTVTGSRPLLILSAGTLSVTGRFDADGSGALAGPGGGEGGPDDALAGHNGTHVGNYTDGGGGGGGGAFAGGRGGGVVVDDDTLVPRAAGGAAHAEDEFLASALVGGGGGGDGPGDGGDGGGGGGVLQFSARGRLSIAGTLNVSGGAGLAGTGDGNWGAGGGGGGGGSILLESGTEVIFGGTILAAGGGGGGSASCRDAGENGHEEDVEGDTDGGDGSDERCSPLADMPSTRNYAADGGAGGTDGPGTRGRNENDPGANGGGGGGGAGLIVVRAPVNVVLTGSGTPRFQAASSALVDAR